MILFKTDFVKDVNKLTQELYRDAVELIVLAAITCPCGHVGFHMHGTYTRRVKLAALIINLVIQRIKCPSCGRTHALLPYCLIPWSQIPLETTVMIIKAKSSAEVEQLLSSQQEIQMEDIKNIKRRFKKHWEQRVLSYGIEYNDNLTDNCISHFGRQFMQIRCGLLLRF